MSQSLVVMGDVAKEIALFARTGGFDLIVMPTHASSFRRMLLGSTTAKVLNDVDCPVLTTQHAEDVVPRPMEHREWLCAIGLDANSEELLRYASRFESAARARLSLIHVVLAADLSSRIPRGLGDQGDPPEKQACRRLDELQRTVGCQAPVRIAVGPVKEALLEEARRSDADVLLIGRGTQSDARGRMRDLTYTVVRHSRLRWRAFDLVSE
jgi:nucleotide-binding universal stress UspA family protein